MQENPERYCGATNSAINKTADFLGKTSKTAADRHLKNANTLLDMPSDYARGLSEMAEHGTGTAAEKAALKNTAREITQSVERIRSNEAQQLIKYGEQAAESAKKASRASITKYGGVAVDSVNLLRSGTQAIETGNWDAFGRTAAGIGASAVAIHYLAGGLAAGLAFIGVTGFPAIVGIFIIGASVMYLTDKYLGKHIYDRWKRLLDPSLWSDIPFSFKLDDASESEGDRKRANDRFNDSKNWQPPRDPLVLDLNGRGIKTTGIGNHPVLFGHNADGIKTATGWVDGQEGLVALDINGNGRIDSGRELFGDNTLLAAGSFAKLQHDAQTRLPESTVRHAFALYQLPSTEEGFADVQIVAADAPLDAI